ncbi:hypothetical protein H257_11082 [Aphanomyces astaci]|uniref:DUF7769 domain-containing protein n=1 Tax=Aphanomyces astaci TaxID=112090 RepID=W4G345_APHAT|nr:hypothetical protein H257_11082 [Aphanomyces astaci]ETV74117.1 hypothetical protein H257_11082 [Aphanomyces astaci]|eukprot:XP_009836223.1 hypothetical protein H257_11082 [Aphanomyces astaci]
MPLQPTASTANRPRNPRGPKGGKTHLDHDERRSIYESLLAVSSSGILPRGAIVKLARQHNCHPDTVKRVWAGGQSSIREGHISADVSSKIRGNSGRKKTRTSEEIEDAIRQVPQESRQTTRALSHACQIPRTTVLRHMAECPRLKARSSYVKPFLTPSNIQERLRVAALLFSRQRHRRRQRRLEILRLRGILRERNAVESAALHDAAWYTMYRSRNTPSFLTTVSLPPDDFDDLLQVFDQEYTVLSGPGRRGRPPRIQHKHAVLAMTLHFYTAAVEHKTLQDLFGVSPSTFARVLSNAERAVGRSLNRIADAAVRWPTTRQQQHWATLTNAKEPLVEGVFAFVDGKNYRVQSPSNIDLQNAQFNGR